MRAFRIIIDAAKSYYEEMLFFFMTGAVLLIPVIVAASLLQYSILSLLLLLVIPFAAIGIWMVAHRAVRGLGVKWRLYWEAVKEYGPRALVLSIVILFGYIILLSNIWFYNNPEVSPIPANITGIIMPVWVVLTVVWTSVAFYALAFLIELEEPKLLTILRNGLSLFALRLLVTLILLVVTGLLTALSIVIPILLIALPGFIAVLSITAVRTLIIDLREQYADKQTDEETDDGEEKTDAEDDASN